ncbi:hypothetical protein PAXRUDRAFT_829439 [Paxillus rubicundulus Ve08.2h10]|uniref:Uncharacterized protein n=1 Tax=Paxillus rubicundulus Ve08.2h10 TaxID=930991 RepID=A0A0D0DMT7_9AGAM|nr:hypothetical protein PAXRUDRAFT_829439 [Paxillus rubicundulus Ve08.2h10]
MDVVRTAGVRRRSFLPNSQGLENWVKNTAKRERGDDSDIAQYGRHHYDLEIWIAVTANWAATQCRHSTTVKPTLVLSCGGGRPLASIFSKRGLSFRPDGNPGCFCC